MIIHASRAFGRRFKCRISLPRDPVEQTGRLDAWSVDIVNVERKSAVLAMNDATLYSIVVPIKGGMKFEDFIRLLLARVRDEWAERGVHYDPDNETIMILKRANRSLIGSMNEAVQLLKIDAADQIEEHGSVNFEEIEHLLNRTPYSYLQYESPLEALNGHLAKLG